MLFSILMAHYNNARFLKQSITSVLDQSYANWELVILDDGSTDDFDVVIEEYKNDPRIRIYKNDKNLGTATTKALCVNFAKGVIAGYLDPDDALDPETLAIMVKAHQNNPGCSIVHSTNYVCDGDLKVIKVSECPRPLPTGAPYLLLGDGSIHHFVSFKLHSYKKTQGLEQTKEHDRASDQELYYLLEEQGEVKFVNKPLHYYRIHGGSISNMGNEDKTLRQHYTIIEKACLRRIRELKIKTQPDAGYWIKQYNIRYRKVKTLHSFREHRWLEFAANLTLFSLVGGYGNLKSYVLKLQKEGVGLLRRSLTGNYNAIK